MSETLTKATPTPGPWETVASHARGGDERLDVGIVATLMDTVGTPTVVIAEAFGRVGQDIYLDSAANARLIASAPDLLAAVRDFVSLYDRTDDVISAGVLAKVKAARAALAKAEGR